MPPCARGPVLTVKSPILNGAACACTAGILTATALALLANMPASTVLRLMVMAFSPLLIVTDGLSFWQTQASARRSRLGLGTHILWRLSPGGHDLDVTASVAPARSCRVSGRCAGASLPARQRAPHHRPR